VEKDPNNTQIKRRMLALALGCAVLASSAARAQDPRSGEAVEAALRVQAEQGARVFAERCSPCHGDDAHGDIGPNLTDTQWIYGGSASAVRQSVSEGRPGGMPAWNKKLTPEQIDAVVAFVGRLQAR
jgi:cytochrome c oxidase cbb3-type subunit 3